MKRTMKQRFRRQAFSLLESVIVISLLSLVMSLSATMLIASFRMHDHAVEREDLNRSLARFSLRLRTDAHAAISVEELPGAEIPGGESPAQKSTSVRLQMRDGRSISYIAGAGEIHRRVERDDTIKHQDVFQIPGFDATLSIEASKGTEANRSLIATRFRSVSHHPAKHPNDLLPVEAAVGLAPATENAEADE